MSRLSKLSRSVAGKVVLITGAASGMGKATAELFADEGARVAVTDINGDAATAVADRIVASGSEAHPWQLDVADPARVETVVAEIAAKLGSIDILINNAGISVIQPIDSETFESDWQRSLDVNLNGQMRLIRACLPHLRAVEAPRIVNVASTEGVGATAMATPYTAAKHAVIGLTRALAVELGASGATVNCVCPGPILTGMTEPIPAEARQKFARRRVPLRRYGDPEEVAHAILGLALPAASYINGVVLLVDGGLRVQNT